MQGNRKWLISQVSHCDQEYDKPPPLLVYLSLGIKSSVCMDIKMDPLILVPVGGEQLHEARLLGRLQRLPVRGARVGVLHQEHEEPAPLLVLDVVVA